MLDQRRRRWANIGQTLARCVVFAGIIYQLNQMATSKGWHKLQVTVADPHSGFATATLHCMSADVGD